jgi:hypothetical protein
MKVSKFVVALVSTAAIVVGGLTTIGSPGATAAGTNDLVLKQTTSNGAASGETVVTVKVSNPGSETASKPVLTALISTPSTGLGIVPTSASPSTSCPVQRQPSGYQAMFTCQTASIAAGGTWTVVFKFTGTAGKAFTSFMSVGEVSPSDTNMANNATTLNSYFGPAADLQLAQATVPNVTSGRAVIRSTTTNKGPWTANNLQVVAEVKAPNFSAVNASSNQNGVSCQFIPPAAGYDHAFACTLGSLAPGAAWTLTFTHTGTAGTSLQQVTQVTAASPSDPVTSNNNATTNTSYHA